MERSSTAERMRTPTWHPTRIPGVLTDGLDDAQIGAKVFIEDMEAELEGH
jgi:hypothetical protein